MDLLLWRHADAFDARAGESDLDRALSPEGHDQARRIARWLNGVLPADLRVIASPALRALQTAEALGRPVDTLPALAPGASHQALLQAADWPFARRAVLVVGHQPTLGLLAAALLCGQPQHWRIRKAAVWWLRSERTATSVACPSRSPEHESG